MFKFSPTLAVEVVDNSDFIGCYKGAGGTHTTFLRVYTVTFLFKAEDVFPGILGTLVEGGTYGTLYTQSASNSLIL